MSKKIIFPAAAVDAVTRSVERRLRPQGVGALTRRPYDLQSGRVIVRITDSGAGGAGWYEAVEQVWDDSVGAWADLTGGRDFSVGELGEVYELTGNYAVPDDSIVEVYPVGGDEGRVRWVFAAPRVRGNLSYSAGTLTFAYIEDRQQSGDGWLSQEISVAVTPTSGATHYIWMGHSTLGAYSGGARATLVVQSSSSIPGSLAAACRLGSIVTDAAGVLVNLDDMTLRPNPETGFGMTTTQQVTVPTGTRTLVFLSGRLVGINNP